MNPAVPADATDFRAVCEALLVAERQDGLDGRLRALATGVQQLGFRAAAIAVVSAQGGIELLVLSDGAPANSEGAARKARLASLDSPLNASVPALAFPFAVAGGMPLARVIVVREGDDYPAGRAESLRLLGAQAARAIEDARLVSVAERRAARLQRLQEVGVLLSRSLDERRILRELARHVQRILPGKGVLIAQPDVNAGTVEIVLQVEGGTLRPRGSEPLVPGVIADVARSARAVRVEPALDDADARAVLAALVGSDVDGVGSVLAVPMLSQHRLVGVVVVYTAPGVALGAEDEELLGTIAAQAAAAIVNARLYEESQRERRQSEALAEIARAVGGSLRVTEVLQLIQRHAVALLAARGALVAIRKGKFLHVVAATGSGQVLGGMYLPMDGSVSGRAVQTGQPVITNDVRSDPGVYGLARELAAIERSLIAPLISQGQTLGTLAVLDREEPFTPEDGVVLQRFADQVAIALVNARLYEEAAQATRELGETFDSIASGLVLVDSVGHVVRNNARAAELLREPDPALLRGRALGDLLCGDADGEPWPVHKALSEQIVQRGIVRHPSRQAVYDVAASPHPGGGAVVLFEDVTAIHRLGDAFRLLMAGSADACLMLDSTWVVREANAAASAMFGLAIGELAGGRLAQLVHAADRDRIGAELRAAAGGEGRRVEFRVASGGTGSGLVTASVVPVIPASGDAGVLVIAREVTG